MEFPFDDSLKERTARLNPLQLAYMGDTVYDLYVRTKLLSESDGAVRRLHALSSAFVCAKAQSEALARVEGLLCPEEQDIVRRGRNAHSRTIPRNASPADYARATALEALVGYLYLTKRYDRLNEIMRAALGGDGEEKQCQE